MKADEVRNNQQTYLVRGKLHSSVDVHQLEGHSKVLVAVCCEGVLAFGRIVHPGSFKKEKHLVFYRHATKDQRKERHLSSLFVNLLVLVPMLWSLSTTERSMLVTATSVDTFTLSYRWTESKCKVTSSKCMTAACKSLNKERLQSY